jgi:hypothetical protein
MVVPLRTEGARLDPQEKRQLAAHARRFTLAGCSLR